MKSSVIIIIALTFMTFSYILVSAIIHSDLMITSVNCDINSSCRSGSKNNVPDIKTIAFSSMNIKDSIVLDEYEADAAGELEPSLMLYEKTLYMTPTDPKDAIIDYLCGEEHK